MLRENKKLPCSKSRLECETELAYCRSWSIRNEFGHNKALADDEMMNNVWLFAEPGLKQGSVGKIQRFSSFKRQYLENRSSKVTISD